MSSIWTLYFSPTGSTKTIVDALGGVVSGMMETDEPMVVDFTQPHVRAKKLIFAEEDIVFIGVPTYAGRAPNKIMPFIAENLIGNGAYAVPVVTYGNRSFDDSLAELADLLEGNGFRLLGGGAFPCQHAFAENLATGRPDMMDVLQALQAFRGRIRHVHLKDSVSADAKALLDGIDRIKNGLFIFLHVLVIGKRKPLEHGQRAHQVAIDAAGLAAHKLCHVGILLLRHDGNR
jgi:hypothetical protein